jgi:hypothetical protein
MLASFIGAHSDEVPSSAAENGRVQSSAKEQARSTAEKLIISKQLHRPSNEKFPTTLVTILDNRLYESILSWTPDGMAFTIYDKKAFEEQVIPVHFAKSAKFRSFLRKLYRWGFAKKHHPPGKQPEASCFYLDSATYFHKKFRKGRPDLCSEMTCKQHTLHHRAAAGVTSAVADRRFYFDPIPAITTAIASSTTSFPSLLHGASIPHPVDQTRMILPRPVAAPLLLPGSLMARCLHPAGHGNTTALSHPTSVPFLAFPPTFNQYESNTILEESLHRQHEMKQLYNAMLLRRIGQNHDLLQQALNTRNNRLLVMKMASPSYRNRHA